jgi:hypothetical protein
MLNAVVIDLLALNNGELIIKDPPFFEYTIILF